MGKTEIEKQQYVIILLMMKWGISVTITSSQKVGLPLLYELQKPPALASYSCIEINTPFL